QRLYYNDRGWELLGLAPRREGLSVDEVRRRVHPDDLDKVVASARRALHSDRPIDLQARYFCADGACRHVLTGCIAQRGADGRAQAFLGVALDITDEVEQAQRSSELARRLELTAAAANIGIWVLHPRTGAVEWNEKTAQIFGVPVDRPMTLMQWWHERVHPDDRERVLEAWQAATRSGEPVSYEFRVRWPDGSYRWLASRLAPVKNEQGVVVRQIGVNWDVTESKNAEAARQERALALRESQAKSQFLARMSHELRTPLNAVLGFTQLLQVEAESALLQPAQRSKLDHVRNAGEHLLSLITDVLDLSTLEAGGMRLQIEPLLLAQAVHDALPLVEPLARKYHVTLLAQALSGSVMADPTRLRQVLLNLLSNAIKYNRPQGVVRIASQTDATGTTLRIVDTGRGMTAQQLAHLFEPFNRLGREDSGVEGTGIGLAIVKALVERMGGSIVATSRPDEGTEFVLRFTAAASRSSTASRSTSPSGIASRLRCAKPTSARHSRCVVAAWAPGSRTSRR
ncbi:MAG: PAS domain S-box protein, partial [Betaproteobacteria bacterium]